MLPTSGPSILLSYLRFQLTSLQVKTLQVSTSIYKVKVCSQNPFCMGTFIAAIIDVSLFTAFHIHSSIDPSRIPPFARPSVHQLIHLSSG